MKVSVATVLFLSLQLVLSVSSDSTSELIAQLIELVYNESLAANSNITLAYAKSLSTINDILEENILPPINEAYQETENYIDDLENRTSSAGYDAQNCIRSVKAVLDELPSASEKATKEGLDVYENILSYNLFIAQRNIDLITNELDSIATEYTRCVLSQQPEYCNGTLSDTLSAKVEQFPDLYNKEIQRSNLVFLREIANFETRGRDYIQEAISSTKLYLSLLENCVAAVLVA